MDKPKTKNQSSAIFIVGVFVAAVVLMFIAKMQSHNIQTIKIPLNNGIASLSTYNNLLVAASNDNKAYIFDWADLSKKFSEHRIESGDVVIAPTGLIVSVKRANPDYLVVSGLDANSESKKIPLMLAAHSAHLSSNASGSKIILLLEREGKNGDEHVSYGILEVLPDIGQAQLINSIISEKCRLEHFAVSDDGNHIIAVGEKNEHGWMLLADTKEKKVAWQKELPDLKKLFKCAFSKNGDIIYLRGSDNFLTLAKTSSGEIIDRWSLPKEGTYTYRTQYAQSIAVSNDGELVAAVIGTAIFIWDTKTYKKYDITGAGQKVLSSMVFSPDGKLIATSDMRQSGDIKIVHTH